MELEPHSDGLPVFGCGPFLRVVVRVHDRKLHCGHVRFRRTSKIGRIFEYEFQNIRIRGLHCPETRLIMVRAVVCRKQISYFWLSYPVLLVRGFLHQFLSPTYDLRL